MTCDAVAYGIVANIMIVAGLFAVLLALPLAAWIAYSIVACIWRIAYFIVREFTHCLRSEEPHHDVR